jgi:hypothetical protein
MDADAHALLLGAFFATAIGVGTIVLINVLQL